MRCSPFNEEAIMTKTIVYLSHGGGPLPLLGDPGHVEMGRVLKEISAGISRPSAILVVSAHWEEALPTITSGPRPDLIYDYYGFPEAAYRISYPCPGAPDLARETARMLERSGIQSRLDGSRGFDHGLFIPLKIIYPEADIPCIQLSLMASLDPAAHIGLGRALGDLSWENLLVVGSGFSFHNMRAFFSDETPESREKNLAFDRWLRETCGEPLGEQERAHRLVNWEKVPHARYCHPREEHLLPLHFCYGMAGSPCSRVFELEIMGKQSSMILWDPSPDKG